MVQEHFRGRPCRRGRRVAGEKSRPAVLQVGADGRDGRPAQQPDALLAALADDADVAPPEVERGEVRGRELTDPQARRVGHLDDRPVPQRQRDR